MTFHLNVLFVITSRLTYIHVTGLHQITKSMHQHAYLSWCSLAPHVYGGNIQSHRGPSTDLYSVRELDRFMLSGAQRAVLDTSSSVCQQVQVCE